MTRLLPHSVITRVFVALTTAIVLINVSSLFFYMVFHDETAVAAAASQAGDQIIVMKRLMERAQRESQPEMIERLSSPLMNLRITSTPIVEQSDNQFASEVVLDKLQKEFPAGTDIRVDSRIDPRGFEGAADTVIPPSEGFVDFFHKGGQRVLALHDGLPAIDAALFNISIKTPDRDNEWFNARVVLNLGEPKGEFAPFLWLITLSIIIGAVAWWGVHKTTKPLSVFASAAERLGMDVHAQPLPEDGPSEVMQAAHAFNTMQMRIKRFISDRTQMLAAISHDLRTPITRLRLRAEFVDDDVQRMKMLSDLDEMEAMIGATLTFARDEAATEKSESVDVAAVIATVCSDQRAAGRDVSYTGPDSLEFTARDLALKRSIYNFIDNAVKYGKCARVNLSASSKEIVILVDDDGPGIPLADRERVFAPFTRLESSRSRETGGAGLGLTIARNAVRSMGGDVEIFNRPEGGLRVRVTLPIAREELLAAAQ